MEENKDYAIIFKALGDSTRLKIIEMLSCGELCACDILEAFQITQPTLSYHMKTLTESGLVVSRKEGAWTKYSNNEQLLESVKLFWEHITIQQENCICKESTNRVKCQNETNMMII